MAAKASKFSVGMGSSTQVKNMVSKNTMLNNDVDTGYNLKYIPLEKIKPNKLNTDFSQSAIELVRNSIRENGLFHPLVVVKNEDDTYRIISGEQRYHAFEGMAKEELKELFPLGIPCKVIKINKIDGEVDEVDEKIKIKEANLAGRDLTPEEKSKNIRDLIALYQIKQERGEIKSVANKMLESYRMTERMVRKYIAANKMIPELQALLDKGEITITESEKFAAFSEEAQMQIYNHFTSNGKVESTDLTVLRKAEEEKKQLEEKVLETTKELEDKIQMVEALEKQVASLEQEIEKNDSGDTGKKNESDEMEDLRRKLEMTEQLLQKEVKEKKKAQTNLEKARLEAEEKKSRNILASKEELKKAADFARAENIHELMFKQLKELEKVKETIKQDSTLKVNFAVIAEGLSRIFN